MRSRADRRRGALLAALMMAALPLGSLADEALPSPTAEAPAEPTAEPTDAPSAEPVPTPEASPAPEASAYPAPTASDAPSPTPEPSASPEPTAYPLLEPGMSGDEVLMLQNRLVELGYLSYAEGLAPDGLYDEATAAAVAGFQTRLQLEPTGIADDALQLPHLVLIDGEGLFQKHVVAPAQQRDGGFYMLGIHGAVDDGIGQPGALRQRLGAFKAHILSKPVHLRRFSAADGVRVGHADDFEFLRVLQGVQAVQKRTMPRANDDRCDLFCHYGQILS